MISEKDLKRILTTEERNVLVLCGRAKGRDSFRLAARNIGKTEAEAQAILDRAREKIERETRKGGRGVQTAIETVKCGCGEEFTPRRKGELQCPACRELNGDGRPLAEARRAGRAHDPPRPPDTNGGSVNGSGDHHRIARNPPPAQPFPSKPDVEERRQKIVQAIVDEGGEMSLVEVRKRTGIGDPALSNDLTRLTAQGRLIKTGPRKHVRYRTPEYHAALERALDGGEGATSPNRREAILDFIGERERVATMDVSRRFPSVVYQTVKNDLDALHRAGKIVKIRGSAIVEWRLADDEAGDPPYYEQPAGPDGLTDAERAAAASAAPIVKDQGTLDRGDHAATPSAAYGEPINQGEGMDWPEPPPGWRYADDDPTADTRTIEHVDSGVQGPLHDPDGVWAVDVGTDDLDGGGTAIAGEPADRAATEGDDAVGGNEGPPPPSEDPLPDPGEGESPTPPPAPDPELPKLDLSDPVKQAQAHRLLADIEASRASTAELAARIYAEAEALAIAADAAVPETLLRARYIAALLSRIEAGDTSPDLLDRFERLAFGE